MNNHSQKYWRSLAELEGDPAVNAFVEREFPEAAQDTSPWGSRRKFLQLMGASIALAGGAAGCRWPKEKVLPFSQGSASIVPGSTRAFATAYELDGRAVGLLVTSYDGRPIKVEGNPQHPISLGATDVFAQASILDLYDPDRSTKVFHGAAAETWINFEGAASQALKRAKTGGIWILCEPSSSPSLRAMRDKIQATYPGANWVEYTPISGDNVREGGRMAFGAPYLPYYKVDRADVILTLDDDLLEEHGASLKYSRELARRRRIERGDLSRLYSVESQLTTTGSRADHRLPMRRDQIASFVVALEGAIAGAAPAVQDPVAQKFLAAVAKDLNRARGKSLVTCGEAQPPEVHALVHRINETLGNAGQTVSYVADRDPERPTHLVAIRTLTDQMRAGAVEVLFILGGNPAFDAPADLDFKGALAKVGFSVHLASHRDETSQLTTWHLPRSHYLEAWGDVRSADGTISIQQPLIAPLYESRSILEIAAWLAGGPSDARAIVRENFQGSEQAWQAALHDGLVARSEAQLETPPVGSFPAPKATQAKDGFEVTFHRCSKVYDGRFANNGWLQELPDFVTKLTWDNALLLSPETAASLEIEDGDLVELELEGRKLQIAALRVPGIAAGSLGVKLGYGRTHAGNVGGMAYSDVGVVGFDTQSIRTSNGFWSASGAKIRPLGDKYLLAATQDHFAIDTIGKEAREKRSAVLLREATVDEFRKHPEHIEEMVHHPPLLSPWKEWTYENFRWAMVVDVSTCSGCNACVVACQAENNVPIVGKEQVAKNREMHWLRVDRYFSGDPSNPKVTAAPIPCMHCENAPCEAVCPVGATVHSRDGLNDMVYNRCIGTRYCSNNCPYKVRRFNFLNYHKNYEGKDTLRLLHNPEVTVRSRGVMEKCTYCVQRIQKVRIAAKNERRPVRDGEVVPACAQACASESIVFGDLNNPESKVALLAKTARAYSMLQELNTKPRTRYLAGITNPSPDLA